MGSAQRKGRVTAPGTQELQWPRLLTLCSVEIAETGDTPNKAGTIRGINVVMISYSHTDPYRANAGSQVPVKTSRTMTAAV